MKLSTQKLLLTLYPQNGHTTAFPYQLVEVILPELTPAGRRSLLHHLTKEGLIYKEIIADEITLTIAEQGKKALERQFPALKPISANWQGQWQLILFLSPPARDQNFRYLRSLVLSSHALPVIRGVYGFPKAIPEEIKTVLDDLYSKNVLIVTSEPQLGFGSLRQTIVEYFRLSDLISTYSGVSTEIKQLLSQFDQSKRLSNRQKDLLAMVLDRIAQNASDDPGIIEAYYPTSPNLGEVIGEYQRLLHLIFTSV